MWCIQMQNIRFHCQPSTEAEKLIVVYLEYIVFHVFYGKMTHLVMRKEKITVEDALAVEVPVLETERGKE